MEGETVQPGEQLHPQMEMIRRIVPDLQKAIGPNCEVVLRDLQGPGRPIVAISGSITRRQVGDPPTGLMEQWLATGSTNENHLNYSGRTSDNRPLRASTLFIRDEQGVLLGTICINIDISNLLELQKWTADYCDTRGIIMFDTGMDSSHKIRSLEPSEDVKTVISQTVDKAIDLVGVRPEAMKKPDRLAVVHNLDVMGVFVLKNAKEYVASRLGVSKAAIYNYLRETRSKIAPSGVQN